MRRLLIAMAAALLLAGCASAEPTGRPAEDRAPSASASPPFVAEHGLGGQSAEQVVEELDQLELDERPGDLIASVRPDEVVLSDGRDETRLAPPDGLFYLSVAPYVKATHDCFHHSLTTCTGELGGEDVRVRITAADGDVLVDEARTTYANGFTGFWLPRGVEGTAEVTYGDRSGTVEFATEPDSPTCLTTLRLV